MTRPDGMLAVAVRLRDAREFLNLPRDVAASQLGLAEEELEDIETGSRSVTDDEFDALARLYRLSVAFIKTGKDDSEVGRATELAFRRAGGELTDLERANVERFALFLQNFRRR